MAPFTKFLTPAPEVIISSPLTRALTTTLAAFPSHSCPRVAHPLARERVWLSSDVGRPVEQLRAEFAGFAFEEMDGIWWHHGGTHDPLAVHLEPQGEKVAMASWLVHAGAGYL